MGQPNQYTTGRVESNDYTEKICILVPPNVKRELQQKSQYLGLSVGELVRRALWASHG